MIATINTRFPILNLVIHFPYLTCTSSTADQARRRASHARSNSRIGQWTSSVQTKTHEQHFSSVFRESDVYIYHVVWYCDTCLSVVYGNRAQNTSVIQLYNVETINRDNDKITLKSRFLEETRKGSLLTRFLKPFFSPSGAYGFIVRFDPLNMDRSAQKAYSHIARIQFNQRVRRQRERSKHSRLSVAVRSSSSTHKSMPHRRTTSTSMKFSISIILMASSSPVRIRTIHWSDKSIGKTIPSSPIEYLFDCV